MNVGKPTDGVKIRPHLRYAVVNELIEETDSAIYLCI